MVTTVGAVAAASQGSERPSVVTARFLMTDVGLVPPPTTTLPHDVSQGRWVGQMGLVPGFSLAFSEVPQDVDA
jgi:hypothetical protein